CARSRRTSSVARSFSRGRLLLLLGRSFGLGLSGRNLALALVLHLLAGDVCPRPGLAGLQGLALDLLALRLLGLGLGGLDDLGGHVLAGRLALRDLTVSGDATVVRARQRRVRAELAGREQRDAAARELLLLAAEGRVGLGACK